MLANLTPYQPEVDRRLQIAKEHNFEYTPQTDPQWLEEGGIYQANIAFNFTHEEFEEFKDCNNIPYDQSYRLFAPTYKKNQYGVADSIEQIKRYYKKEVEAKRKKYFIVVTPVFQGKGDGWRWHKWGEYIGKLDSKCEYLDDEDFGPGFEYVLCFHIYPLFDVAPEFPISHIAYEITLPGSKPELCMLEPIQLNPLD